MARAKKTLYTFELQEVITPFSNAANLDSENTYLWNQ